MGGERKEGEQRKMHCSIKTTTTKTTRTVQGAVHHSREVKTAGAGSSWLQGIHSQAVETSECSRLTSPFILSLGPQA